MAPWVYAMLDSTVAILFGLMLWHAARRGSRPVLELLTAALFGILLEWSDIMLFKTYSYSTGFYLNIGPVPICIGLCWAMLIYSAMLYSDQLGLPAAVAPFADALWAIMLDLSFDAVAIRMGFWTWTIPMSDGYFGVPAANFHAWLYVALGFSVWTRWVRGRRRGQIGLQLLSPLAAFALLLGGIYWLDAIKALLYPPSTRDQGMLVFVLTVAVFAGIVIAAIWRRGLAPRLGVDVIPTLTRWLMHGYFALWLLAWTLAPQLLPAGMDAPPFLLWVAVALIGLELALLVPILPWPALRARHWQRVLRVQPVLRKE